MTGDDVAYLYRRAGFGAKPDTIASQVGKPRSEVVAQLLDGPFDVPTYPALSAGDSDYQQLVVIRRWWLQQMASVTNPVQEKLTLFWHNLLPTSYWKVPFPQLLLAQNERLRTGAFGPIPALIESVSLDPAMLIFLDNALNRKSSPNENFARELMELFTLGADNGYSQLDVAECARAWSGYNLSANRTFVFDPNEHDGGTKTIFGIAGNWNGQQVIAELLTGSRAVLASEFLARRFWEWYAGPISDGALITQLAAHLRGVGMNTKEFLREMFAREEFYSPVYRNSIVRGPIEWGVGLLRATGLTASGTEIDWALADLGQSPFEPPSVSGWKGNQYWISEAAVWKKATMAGHIGWLANATGFLQEIVSQNVGSAVQTALNAFATPTVSAATRSALESVLTANRDPGIGGSGQRANLIRAIALTPEFQLA
jgi:uncharacterized protein (DUF1800 family)